MAWPLRAAINSEGAQVVSSNGEEPARPFDVQAVICLYDTEAGGRIGPTPVDYFGCLFEVNGELFDCRIDTDATPLNPGESRNVGIRFLNPQLVLPQLVEGTSFRLREIRYIGEGSITSTREI
jgi:hypothetical protein